MTNLETRDVLAANLDVRKTSEGERTIVGIAMPFDEVIDVGGYRETFARGAFGEFSTIPLFYGHGHLAGSEPIGTVTRGEETDNGYEIEARLSNTTRGNDVYELLKDGAISKFSVGFQPVSQRDEDGVTVRTAVDLREVSVVPFPAYAGAMISEVRSENTKDKEDAMSDEFAPKADLVEVRNTVEDMSRKITVLETRGTNSGGSTVKFRSLGEFVKALSTRSASADDAEMLVRAFTGATTADNGAQAPTWVNRDIKLIAQNRNVLELFSKAPLPAEGMSISYPQFGSTVGDVAVQANQGDDLTYLELVTANASAPVLTYGGYSSLSRQVIERNDSAYLNKVLDFQKLSYAKVTNGAVRTLLQTTPAAYNQGTVAFANSTKAGAWVDAALAGTNAIATNSTGLGGDVWLMPFSVFQRLAAIYDTTNRPVFALNGDGANTVGSVDIRGVKANVAGLPVVVDNNLSGTDSFIVSTDAITVMEDGAKYLQDENIINLTKDFSIYGYMAITKNDVKGITRITHPVA